MEHLPKQKEIHSLADIEKMSLIDFIGYLKRPEATPSQKGVGNYLEGQYYGAGVTAGFIQNGINVLNLLDVHIKRDEAKEILEKMKQNSPR